MLGVVNVGRPKRKSDDGEPPRVRIINMKVSEDWAAWLARAAKHGRTDVAKFLDMAAAEYARTIGFDEPAPDRIP